MSRFETIEDKLYDYSLICDAYIYKGEPFNFLNKVMQENMIDISNDYIWDSYDVALDVYNWYNKNGVHHESKRMALMQVARKIIEYGNAQKLAAYDQRGYEDIDE
jgi:3-methyladenine DNA glycosylase AlkC